MIHESLTRERTSDPNIPALLAPPVHLLPSHFSPRPARLHSSTRADQDRSFWRQRSKLWWCPGCQDMSWSKRFVIGRHDNKEVMIASRGQGREHLERMTYPADVDSLATSVSRQRPRLASVQILRRKVDNQMCFYIGSSVNVTRSSSRKSAL
jgi:hypothetical protein